MYGRFKSSKGYATRRTAGIFSYRRRSYLRKVGNKYVSKKSRIGYKKSIERSTMIAQLALVLLNMVLVMQVIQQQQQMQLQVSVLKQVVGMVSILINH